MVTQTRDAAVRRWGGPYLFAAVLWLVILAPGAGVLAPFFVTSQEMQAQMPMPTMPSTGNPTPPVKGFAEGQEIRFIHTEASDPQVAAMLTQMMGPKVLVVPSLREIPNRLLATVFVFRNGVRGEGPFGFQPDVFDTPPGDPRYTPLRRVTFVTWRGGRRARLLRSAADIKQAGTRSEVTLTRSKVVVNMPMLTWPGGER